MRMLNRIPIIKITSVDEQAELTDFITTYRKPLYGEFYLDFSERFLASYNTSEFTRSTDDPIPLLTRSGGNVHTDMISQAIVLKKIGRIPSRCCPYRFKMAKLTDPDRVIFLEPLPASVAPVIVPPAADAPTGGNDAPAGDDDSSCNGQSSDCDHSIVPDGQYK